MKINVGLPNPDNRLSDTLPGRGQDSPIYPGTVKIIEVWNKTVLRIYPGGKCYIDKTTTTQWVKYEGKIEEYKERQVKDRSRQEIELKLVKGEGEIL